MTEKIEILEATGEYVRAGLTQGKRLREDRVRDYDRKLEVLNRMPIKLGNVLMSSGKDEIINNRRADWAVISLESGPFQGDDNGSLHVNKMAFLTRAQIGLESVSLEGMTLDGWGGLTERSWYCKTGRGTDVTTGVCDGITGFCLDGDAGSGIINHYGDIYALLHASAIGLCGHTELCSAMEVCSSMSDARDWIETKATQTGGPRAILDLPWPTSEGHDMELSRSCTFMVADSFCRMAKQCFP